MKSISKMTTAFALMLLMAFSAHAQDQRSPDQEQDRQQYEEQERDRNQYEDKEISEVLKDEDRFSTFAELLEESGLMDLLHEDVTYTVFAPTNEAFEEMDQQELEELREDEERLREVMLQHVYVGDIDSQQPDQIEQTRTATGTTHTHRMEQRNGQMQIGQATITEPDLRAKNGVIHVIDKVIQEEEEPEWEEEEDFEDDFEDDFE